MSSSMEFVATRRFSHKTSFSQTCSRLSQYLKENGSFGDLSLGIASKPDVNGTFGNSRQPTTTMSLFPCEASNMDSMAMTQDFKPKNLNSFPRQLSFSSSSSSVPKENVLRKTQITTRSAKQELQTAPLTMFYNGQVIVFNDFSAEKAKEVMNLASKGTASSSFTGFTSNVNSNVQSVYTPNLAKNQTEISSSVTPIQNQVPHPRKIVTQEPIQSSATPLTCELPIARRASLHRFLEKRKDRVTSKAPYQLSDPAKASSKPQALDNMSWLGLAAFDEDLRCRSLEYGLHFLRLRTFSCEELEIKKTQRTYDIYTLNPQVTKLTTAFKTKNIPKTNDTCLVEKLKV